MNNMSINIIKKKDKTKYTHDDIFIMNNNIKSINKKIYKKVRRLINVGEWRHPYKLCMLIILWVIITSLIFYLIIDTIMYLKYVGIVLLVIMYIIIFATPIFKKYLENSYNVIVKVSEPIRKNRYDIFIDVFAKKHNKSIDETELQFDHILLKNYLNNKNNKINLIENILFSIIGLLISYYIPLKQIKELNVIPLTVMCFIIYIIVETIMYCTVDKFSQLILDRDYYILEMYETLIIYHNDETKFKKHYNFV